MHEHRVSVAQGYPFWEVNQFNVIIKEELNAKDENNYDCHVSCTLNRVPKYYFLFCSLFLSRSLSLSWNC